MNWAYASIKVTFPNMIKNFSKASYKRKNTAWSNFFKFQIYAKQNYIMLGYIWGKPLMQSKIISAVFMTHLVPLRRMFRCVKYVRVSKILVRFCFWSWLVGIQTSGQVFYLKPYLYYVSFWPWYVWNIWHISELIKYNK